MSLLLLLLRNRCVWCGFSVDTISVLGHAVPSRIRSVAGSGTGCFLCTADQQQQQQQQQWCLVVTTTTNFQHHSSGMEAGPSTVIASPLRGPSAGQSEQLLFVVVGLDVS